MGDPTIPHFSVHTLAKAGLEVLDGGDGGYDHHLGEWAVDPLDVELRVITTDGATVYDGTKDNFATFSTQMEEILSGRPVVIKRDYPPKARQLLRFEGGTIQESVIDLKSTIKVGHTTR